VALRVGEDRPRHVALAQMGGRRTESLEARDQLRLLGRRGGGEIEVHTVLRGCLGFRDGNDVDADGDRVRPNEAAGGPGLGGHAGFPLKTLQPSASTRDGLHLGIVSHTDR
jgi:hypothetical protein